MDCIIVRYAELALKGQNRVIFERKLISNIKNCLNLNNHKYINVERVRNRIIIHTEEECPQLRNVFGISSYSPAVMTSNRLEDIKSVVMSFAEGFKQSTSFRITTQRLSKDYELDSLQLDREIGSFVIANTHAKVSLMHFDVEIGIEIHKGKSYIFTKRVPCFGGLPLGASGRVAALISDKYDLVACWLMMRRGIIVLPTSFNAFDISLLKKFSYGYTIELTRLRKLSDLAEFMREKHLKALVVGQTLNSLENLPLDALVLRPLIGFDGKSFEELYAKIK